MVVSYTQLLARDYQGKLDASADQFIGYAVEGARRMEMLLKNLREYWLAGEPGGGASVRVDSNIAFDKAVELLDRVIQESGARITHDPLPVVLADDVALTVVFQNLIGNGIKYRRAGERPRVHVRAEKQDGSWRLSVRDNGIGIESQYLDTIFAPFKRLHGSSEYPGSGLGLAICKKIVEHSGGRIWAESSGQGSVLHFTLPQGGEA